MLSICTILAVSKLSRGFEPGVLGSKPSVFADYIMRAEELWLKLPLEGLEPSISSLGGWRLIH